MSALSKYEQMDGTIKTNPFILRKLVWNLYDLIDWPVTIFKVPIPRKVVLAVIEALVGERDE